jgi:hypothetical protein
MGKYILIISTSLLTAMAMAASPYDTFGIGISGLNILQSATFYKNKI